MAHLICDVGLGVGSPNEESWQSFLSETWVRYKVVSDAMKALCEAAQPGESGTFSEFKSLGFVCRISSGRERPATKRPLPI